jgi:hypothetical protein
MAPAQDLGFGTKARTHLAKGRAEEALGEGEHEHVEEPRRHAGCGPEVRHGGESERDAGGRDGEPVVVGQRAAVDDVAALHDGAGEPHAHRLHQLPPQRRRDAAELRLHRPERRGCGARRPPAPAPEERVVAGEERGGEAKATSSGHFGFFFFFRGSKTRLVLFIPPESLNYRPRDNSSVLGWMSSTRGIRPTCRWLNMRVARRAGSLF